MSEDNRIALSIGVTKEAALYFDYVIPLLAAPEGLLADGPDLRYRHPQAYLPPEIHDNEQFTRTYTSFNMGLMFNPVYSHYLDAGENADHATRVEAARDFDKLIARARERFAKHGLAASPILVPSFAAPDDPESPDAIGVILKHVKLVDASRISWEHVAEVRRDRESRVALRRLRLFALQNYAGRSRALVEDDLMQRVDDYEQAAKRLGLDLKLGALATLLGSNTIAATFGASILDLISGKPLIAATSAAVGSAIEIGRTTLEVIKLRAAYREALQSNPVSYIAKLRELPQDA